MSSAYKRILLKVSGEALAGDNSFGIEPPYLQAIAGQIADVARSGVQVAIVVGGGNTRAGDVFLWHEQLLHGGTEIADMQRTRKSLVTHYWTKSSMPMRTPSACHAVTTPQRPGRGDDQELSADIAAGCLRLTSRVM